MNTLIRFVLLLALQLSAGPAFAMPHIMPQQQAAHFCQLLINDGQSIAPLSKHARHYMMPNDSLTVEQMFAAYIFHQGNWQALRIFPHYTAEGTVDWYAPTDDLPASLGKEHQKYIHEALPRLASEIEAHNWKNVDAFIDKMIRYQCQFSNKTQSSHNTPRFFVIIITLFVIVMPVSQILFVSLHRKKTIQ